MVRDFFEIDWNDRKPRQWVLIVLLFILFFILLQNFILQPELKKQKFLSSKIQKLESQLQQLEKNLIEQAKSLDAKQLHKREATIQQLLPIKLNRADLLKWLTQNIEVSNLQLVEQSFEEMKDDSPIQILNVNISLKGTFEGVQKFIQVLHKSTYLLILNNLQINSKNPSEIDPHLAIKLNLTTHHRAALK